jgi:hypothetical protein
MDSTVGTASDDLAGYASEGDIPIVLQYVVWDVNVD